MIRLRMHDDGRWALLPSPDLTLPWAVISPGFDTVQAVEDDAVHGPGWHEAVVLPVSEQGARRLAEAMRGSEPDPEYHRAVLDRLAAGTEGER